MNNNDHSTVLHLHRLAPGRVPETWAGEESSLTASIRRQPPIDRPSGAFNPETTVTFVRKKPERTLNDAEFVDNMSKK